MTSSNALLLENWDLPSQTIKKFRNNGVKSMFKWQAECLQSGDALSGGNLLYSAPTSAGKTLVAEVLALKRVLATRRKAIFILPFVSIAREKANSLRKLYSTANVKVGGFMGSHTPPGGIDYVDVAICTIERANGIINRLLESGNLAKLCVIVVDELHMVGDGGRGFLLEPLLTKVNFHTKKFHLKGCDRIQIVGMSATLPNLPVLAHWLDAALYTTSFRPIPLTQYVKLEERIYDSDFNYVRDVQIPGKFKNDEEMIVNLCLETVSQQKSVLIFCPTKAWCESLSWRIAKCFHLIYTEDEFEMKRHLDAVLDKHKILAILDQFRQCPSGVNPKIKQLVSYICAYHHAGLTTEERDIIENGFRDSTIRILVSTTTLSAGVNLPAQRVIIRSPLFCGKLISTHTYKQMCGRAGRKGIDTSGESILICKATEREKVLSLITSEVAPARSQLITVDADGNVLVNACVKRALLEIIASQNAGSVEDLYLYLECTLMYAELDQKGKQQCHRMVEDCVKELTEMEFIIKTQLANGTTRISPSQLGQAVFASSMNPDDSLLIFSDLNRARKNMVLENDLHIIYLVTPLYASTGTMDWMRYVSLFERLPSDKQRVAELVGVSEQFIMSCHHGKRKRCPDEQKRLVRLHTRFYAALILDELANETPLLSVESRYGMNRGALQSLQQQASTFAGMVSTFCAKLGWSALKLLMKDIQPRLETGVKHELVELISVPSLDARMARHFYSYDVHTLDQLCIKTPAEIMDLLITMLPYERGKVEHGETEWEKNERMKRRVFISGQKSLTVLEAATTILEEARLELTGGIDCGTPNQPFSGASTASTDTQLSR